MNTDKKLQAKHLFFQTELSKTQIAQVLCISRRTLHYWIKEGSWQRLRQSATHLPSLLAEKCYHLFGHLADYYLSERRLTNPLTHREADTLHKLTITINKLANRTTINENMEMFAFFLDGLRKKNPELAGQLAPYIDEYIGARASVYARDVMPGNFTDLGRTPFMENIDLTEQQLDNTDLFDWENERLEAEDAMQEAARLAGAAILSGIDAFPLAPELPSAPALSSAPALTSAPTLPSALAPDPALSSAPDPALSSALAPELALTSAPALNSLCSPSHLEVRAALAKEFAARHTGRFPDLAYEVSIMEDLAAQEMPESEQGTSNSEQHLGNALSTAA